MDCSENKYRNLRDYINRDLQRDFTESLQDPTPDQIQKEITDLETTARAFALEQFELTKEPKIGYGLSIVQHKQFEYDSDKALEWAKERGLALKLDTSKFKKLAEVEELDFVSFDKKPSVNISKTIVI